MSQICPLRLVVQQLITEDKCGYIVETRLYVVFLSLNDCFERKPFNNNDRNQVLWASETEHPTQALTFTKTAGCQPGWGHCYVRSSALSSTIVLVKGAIVMLNSSPAKNEKETGPKLAFAKSSGIVTGDATVSYWPICLCEIKVNSGQFPSRFNSRELKQQRQWRLRKRQLKGTVKSQKRGLLLLVQLPCFKLYRAYSISFSSSNVGNFLWSWILKDCMKVQERKNKVVFLCSRSPQNVKLGIFTS